jgi:hypothetical protein
MNDSFPLTFRGSDELEQALQDHDLLGMIGRWVFDEPWCE